MIAGMNEVIHYPTNAAFTLINWPRSHVFIAKVLLEFFTKRHGSCSIVHFQQGLPVGISPPLLHSSDFIALETCDRSLKPAGGHKIHYLNLFRFLSFR